MANVSRDGSQVPNDGDVYLPLEDAAYKGPLSAAHKEKPLPTAAQSSAVQTGARGKSIGARPIRWSWWALAVGISAVLWFGIARAFGWF